MQQIERYGVIALVFLLVTIVAVSFWGDGKSPGFWSRLTGRAKKEEVAKVDPTATAPVATAERALDGTVPLTNVTPDPLQTQPALGAPAPVATLGAAQPPVQAEPFVPLSMSVPQGQVGQPIASQTPAVAPMNVGAQPTLPITPPSAPVASANEYTVQRGDSLASIARRTLGSEQRWSEIQALNPGVNAKSLKVGAKLALPAGASTATVASKSATDVTPKKAKSTKPAPSGSDLAASITTKKTSGQGTYTIQRGDTLNAIAEKRLGSKTQVKEILALNPGLDPRRLVVGKTISMPSAKGSGTTPRAETEHAVMLAEAKPRASEHATIRDSSRPHVR